MKICGNEKNKKGERIRIMEIFEVDLDVESTITIAVMAEDKEEAERLAKDSIKRLSLNTSQYKVKPLKKNEKT